MANFLLTAIEEPSLWEEIWKYLEDKYFTIDYGNYQHLQMSNPVFSIRTLLICFWVGIVLAAALAIFNKRVLGDFVRALLREEALSGETAKTLAELGFLRSTVIRQSLRSGVTLRRVVRCREEEEYLREMERKRAEHEEKRKSDPSLPKFKAKEFRVNVDEHHFYIPEELKYTADVKFEQKGSSWLGAVVFLVVLIVAMVILLLAMPTILSFLDGWFGNIYNAFSYKDNVVT